MDVPECSVVGGLGARGLPVGGPSRMLVRLEAVFDRAGTYPAGDSVTG